MSDDIKTGGIDLVKEGVSPDPTPKLGSGALLAAERKKQGIEVEQVAQSLNMSISQIKTLELDKSDGLSGATYIRGYIRSYAKLLDLDAEEVLTHYIEQVEEKTKSYENRFTEAGSVRHRSHKAKGNKIIKTIMVLLLIIGGAYLWFSGALKDVFTGNKAGQVMQNSTVLPTSNVEQISAVKSTTPNKVITPIIKSDAKSDAALSESVELGNKEAIVEPVNEPVVKNQHSLVLQFTETSWVDIRDLNDKRLIYKSYAKGESLDVTSEIGMHVFIGNAQGVTVQYNSTPFDISKYREGVYAKFTVGDDEASVEATAN